MDIIIRRATKADIPALVRLDILQTNYHAKLAPTALKTGRELKSIFHKFFLKQLARRKARVFVAVKNKRIIGFLICEIMKQKVIYRLREVGFISALYVESTQRRSGAGKELLEEATTWLKSKGMRRLELGVMTNNKIGIDFWMKQGLRPWWVRMWKKI